MVDITRKYFARDRREWRAWLAKNYATRKEVWLVLLKRHVEKPCVPYDEAVEEAICFGWIDGLLKRIDEEKHAVRFTPRKRDSVWSEENKKRARRMIRAGKMTEAGLRMVEEAKESGEWQKATIRERGEIAPYDLARALAENQAAQENFKNFAPSYQRMYIGWVLDAKREGTRRIRISEVVKRSAKGLKPGA